MRDLMNNKGGVTEAIQQKAYTDFALPPRTPWLDAAPPSAPVVTYAQATQRLTIAPPAGEMPLWYVVAARVNGVWHHDVIGAVNREYSLAGRTGGLPQDVVITAVDRNGNESGPATLKIR